MFLSWFYNLVKKKKNTDLFIMEGKKGQDPRQGALALLGASTGEHRTAAPPACRGCCPR